MEYTIHNDRLTLSAVNKGAGLYRITKADGRELLWDGKPDVWPGRAPVCAPWVGKLEEGCFEADGVRYEAPARHGLVRVVDHEMTEQGSDHITFTRDFPDDPSQWPWPFRFTTTHKLDGNKALTICTVENLSDKPMPVQVGFHPGFVVPFVEGSTNADYRFRFESGKVVPVEEHMFDVDSICFTDVGKWVRLEHKGSGKYIEVNTADFYCTLLWSNPGIPGFLCIEPWDGFVGPGRDLLKRPGAQALAPGEKKTWTLEITFEV